MNEKTEPATPKGLVEAPGAFRSPDSIEQPERPTRRPEELRGQDLRWQDLTAIEGLLPEHLAGADLTGAKLPDEIARFPALAQVAAISSEARKIFIGLLAACVYSWLVIGTTKDVQLIVNTTTSPLPIINTPIPIAGFYVVGAGLLAAVYCYLHFYLHYLWRALATLPAVFPDGVALDDKSDPWLLSNFVRVYFERLKPDRHPLKRLETSLSIALAWVLVPFTLFALWVRYLPSHGWLGTYWLVILTGFTTIIGWHFFRYARAALSGEALPSNGPGLRGTWRELHALSWKGRIFWSLAVVAPLILVACSEAAFRINPRDDRSWAARGLIGLRLLGIRTYAELREVNVAEPPDGWDGKDWSKVKRVDLRGSNLAFADATGAFLTNVDLRGSNLTGAHLSTAQLQSADLGRARLQGAELSDAQLQGANLSLAQLQGADLRYAELLGADLRVAQLQGADLGSAQLQGADLGSAQLQGADLGSAQLQGANLSHAQLQGADLRYAELLGADLSRAHLQGANLSGALLLGANLSHALLLGANLSDAQLQGADLSGALLLGADLRGTTIWRAQVDDARWEQADLRGSTVQPMTTSDIDNLISEATKGIPDEDGRTKVAEALTAALRTKKRSSRPDFPEEWRSKPNVMFSAGDPEPEPLDWGRSMWATDLAYDEALANGLGNLACDLHAAEAEIRGLVSRAINESLDGAWPALFVVRLTGPDCSPAQGLPEEMRRDLESLAATVEANPAGTSGPGSRPPADTE